MKKYLLNLLVFIFGIFFLVSCDIKSNNIMPIDESQTSNSKDDDAKQTESDESKPKDDDSGTTTPQEDVYFNVVFKDYDGTVLQTSQIKEGTTPTYNKSNPVRSNDENYKYEFSGWSPEITAITSNITYIAQYNKISYSNYTITFKDYDGTVLQESQVKEGTIPTYNKSNPVRQSDGNYKYAFSCWNPQLGAVTGDTTYIAQYTKTPLEYYTVQFKDYDNTILDTQSVKEGAIPTYNKSNPVRLNDENYKYEFNGWSPEITVVTSNTTYTAQYTRTELPYTISFDLDNGTSASGVSTIKIETLTKDKFKFDITKSKYVFRGWEYNGTQVFDENGNIINNIQLSSNMIFKAIFEESVTLTITYSIYNPKTNQLINTYTTKPNDLGGVSETRSYHWNTPVNLFANPNEGYRFLGWYYNGTPLSNSSNYNYMMWEDDITIDARFEYSKYDLNIWSNNTDLGQVMIRNGNSQVWYDDQTQKQYFTESTTIAAYTKTDTRFLGWYDENNNLVSTNAVYTFTMPNRDYTLEAKWNHFNITYDLDGGTNNVNNPTSYNKDMSNIQLLNPIKDGYTFQGWEYEGNIITEINISNVCHMKLKANWSVHTNTSYKVEHYLQNLDDDNYPDTPYEVDNLTGTTDTLTNGELNTYEGFISPEITQVNINGDESTVIKLYYVRKTYEISSNNVNAGSIIGYGIYKYGKNITIQITTYLGYKYIGTYMNNSLYTDKLAYVIESISSNYEIRFELIPELSNFTFTSTVDNLTITDVKDKTVTNIVVPNIVTNISLGAFNGCSSLESITLQFVGDKRHTSTDTYQYPLGYIFGTSSYTGGTSTSQSYYGSSTSSTTYTTYYIPTTLKEVIIIDCEYIQNGAFFNCSSLTSITIPNSVTSIAEKAFKDCNKLKDVYYDGTIEDWCGIIFGSDNSNPMYYATNFYLLDENGDVKYNNKNYILTTELEIPSSVKLIGNYQFYGFNNLLNIVIPNCIVSVGNMAFRLCKSLTSIIIPNSVTNIGEAAFSGCSSLESISLPFVGDKRHTPVDTYQYPLGYVFGSIGGVSIDQYYYGSSITSTTDTTYYVPYSLKNVMITDCEYIQYGAFINFDNLKSIKIPNSVTSIGSRAFSGCSSLTSITIPNSVTSIGSRAFSGCSSLTSITIPNSVTSIEEYMFNGCSKLTSITMPNSVTSIGNYAFSSCSSLNIYYDGTIDEWCNITFTNLSSNPMFYGKEFYLLDENGNVEYNGNNYKLLTELNIPNTVTSIGDYQFCGLDNLITVFIPKSVTSIGFDSFNYCRSLVSITIPNSVTKIGYIFDDTGIILENVYYDGTIEEWCNITFFIKTNPMYYATNFYLIDENGNVEYNDKYYKLLTELEIPSTVISIGEYQFSSFNNLTAVFISNGVTNIGKAAFSGCSSLEYVIIPNSVTSIGSSAFEGCSSLTTVFYGDTKEKWDLISVDYNYELTKAKIYYFSEIQPTEQGNYWHYDDDGNIIVWN